MQDRCHIKSQRLALLLKSSLRQRAQLTGLELLVGCPSVQTKGFFNHCTAQVVGGHPIKRGYLVK